MKVYDLGLISYEKASAVQEKLVNNRLSGLITSDILLFAEHYPVITIGRDGHKENLLFSPELYANLNITLAEANRGGDITYHGPGQIICYPIVKLKGPEQDVLQLIRNYETAVMFTLKTFSIESERMNGLTGVWVGSKKIAAIGVAIKNWVSFHGFALNVNSDLKPFSYIIPCGIKDKGVISMQSLLNREIEPEIVKIQLTESLGKLLKRDVEQDNENCFFFDDHK